MGAAEPVMRVAPLDRPQRVPVGDLSLGEVRAGGKRRLRRRDTRAALIMADLMAVAGAFAMLAVVHAPLETATLVAALLAVAVHGTMCPLHRRRRLAIARGTLDDAAGCAHTALIVTLLLPLLDGRLLAVATLVSFGVTSFVLMLALRHQLHRAAAGIAAGERCLLVGEPWRFETFGRHLAASAPEAEIVGCIDIVHVGTAGVRLEELVARHAPDRLIVLADEPVELTTQVVRQARRAGVPVTVCPRIFEAFGSDLSAELVGGSVAVTAGPATLHPVHERAKRMLDIAGALAMGVLFTPVLVAASIAIKLTSPGPVLFWQERIGRDGRVFRIAKFRTMVLDAEALKAQLRAENEAGGGLFKLADDPRVTSVGRWLRRTSLDELPQLINVLRGEMSLVGPRPLVGDEDELVGGWHRDRLRLSPGMTGPWQVAGSARVPLQDMVVIDHHYVTNWSLAADLKIMLRTAGFMLARRGI